MIWKEVEEKYGKTAADLMRKSPWLEGITVTMRGGEMDIPEEDIERAHNWAVGKRCSGWD